MTKLRWGILGVAFINERLRPAFAKAANAELRAIASRSLEKAQKAARAADIPTAHGSYDALLDDPQIDAVYIPLPNTLHDEWTRKAAEHGKHILCEKPLTPTAGEARALVDFCRAKGVRLMDGFMWPHHPRTAQMRQLLDSGVIGPVQHVTACFTFPLPMDPSNIRLQPELAGGSLLDVGCYPIYGIRWALGAEPVRVFATARFEHGVDVEVHGLMWLADGRTAAFDCGFALPMRKWLEAVGTKGILRVPDLWVPGERATFTIERDDRPAEEVVIEGEDQVQHMIEDFGRAVQEGKPVRPDPEEAVRRPTRPRCPGDIRTRESGGRGLNRVRPKREQMPMSKRQIILVAIALTVGLLAGAAWLEPTRTVRGLLWGESFYAGRCTSYWRTALRDGEVAPLKAGGVEAVPVLAESLQDRDPTVRKRAAEMLGELGPEAKEARGALLRAVAEGDEVPDSQTMEFLQKMAAVRAEHPNAPIEVQNADLAALDAAAQALKKVDPEATKRAGLP